MIKISHISKILILSFFVLTPRILFASTFTPLNTTPDDLFLNMQNEIDARILGVTADDTSKKLWTTRATSTGSWVWNPSVWTNNADNINWTGMVQWNTESAYTKGGVLISPRHAVFAEHHSLNNGTTVVFVASDGQIVTRTIVSQEVVVGTDIEIVLLDSPVPGSITHYPVFSQDTWEKYLRDGVAESSFELPLVVVDTEDKLLVKVTHKDELWKPVHISIDHQAGTGTRLSFNELLVAGESGSPAFVFVGSVPVLLMSHIQISAGPNYSFYFNSIEDVMDNLSGFDEYDLSTIDLSDFNAPIVVSETQDFSVIARLATSTPVGTVAIEHNIESDTPFYAISSGNSDGVFAIASSTGVITVASSTLVYTDNNFPRTIVLKVSENDANGRASYATTTVSITSYPVFSQASYTFSLDENEIASTVVGTTTATDDEDDTLAYSIISGNTDNAFVIATSTGVITVSAPLIVDYEDNPSFDLIVRVTETESAEEYYTDVPVTITINDLDIEFQSATYSFDLSENTTDGYVIDTVEADIIDTEDISGMYYSIVSGNDTGIFAINSSTGAISVTDDSLVDYYADNSHTLIVGVSDTAVISTILDQATVTISIIEQGEPNVYFSSRTSTAEEDDPHSVTVSLSGTYVRDIEIDYYASDVSAVAGSDFNLTASSITIPEGSTSANIPILILSDNLIEANESFVLRLSSSNYGALSSPTQHAVTITNVLSSSRNGGGGGGGSSKPKAKAEIPVSTGVNPPTNISPVVTGHTPLSNIPNTSSQFTRDLEVGAQGDDVKSLQEFLIVHKYLLPNNITGYFGLLTKGALIEYQKAKGIIPAVGYFGPRTKATISDTPGNTTPIQSVPTQILQSQTLVFVSNPTTFTQDLELGIVSEDVRSLQKFLNTHGFFIADSGVGSDGNETNYFGPATQTQVIEFQKTYGIVPASGYVGPKTRAKIQEILE